jgi:hypothetical protein
MGHGAQLRVQDKMETPHPKYEQRLDVSEAMIPIALGSLLLCRIENP